MFIKPNGSRDRQHIYILYIKHGHGFPSMGCRSGGVTEAHRGGEGRRPWQTGLCSQSEHRQLHQFQWPVRLGTWGPGHRAGPAQPWESRPPGSAGLHPRPGRWLRPPPPRHQSEHCGSSQREGRSAAACGACAVGRRAGGSGMSRIGWCRQQLSLPERFPLPGTRQGLSQTLPHLPSPSQMPLK